MSVAAFTDNARTVLARRYLLRRNGALVETPEQLLDRVVAALASAERDPHGFSAALRRALGRLELLPNSPTLMNAGKPNAQLAACFVLPVADDLSGIFDAVKWAAMIQKTGGGTGFSFSRLRPASDRVASTEGAAGGPLPFIDVFDAATDAIKQGGVRRGANMAVLRIDHPDVLEFIAAKGTPGRLTNFNVSVAVTDAFMHALAEKRGFALRNPRSGEIVREVDAAHVWSLITRMAWRSGEPGVIFIDRVNAQNPTPALGDMEATNPCGELPLLPFEACNLGSIDVGKLVVDGSVDWSRLAELSHLAVRLRDDVIEVNHYPLPQIAAITRANRKIGVGVMGLADAFIRLGIPYDSEAAVAVAEEIARFVERETVLASERLAVERGAFANWEGSRWQRMGRPPRRNATTTTIAPTGTISILAGCSSGIEPLFAVSYVRNVLDGARLTEVHPLFVARGDREGWGSASLYDEVARRGSVRGMAAVPTEVQRLFATAYDVAPHWHVRMQAAFQAHVHNSVSKTINLPRTSTVEEVAGIYLQAFASGCKGITVYRDGSREGQVLSFGASAAVQVASCPGCATVEAPAQGSCNVCRVCGESSCAPGA